MPSDSSGPLRPLGFRATGKLCEKLNTEGTNDSYCRTWKCPDCGWTVDVSYEDLTEVGTPICGDCDVEMELL